MDTVVNYLYYIVVHVRSTRSTAVKAAAFSMSALKEEKRLVRTCSSERESLIIGC